jgi:hypothetical protein
MPSEGIFTLEAVVDQDFGKPQDPTKVDPPEMSGKPQLHLSKMRLEEGYRVRAKGKSGKTLRGRRVLKATKDTYASSPLPREQADNKLTCKLTPIEGYCKYLIAFI